MEELGHLIKLRYEKLDEIRKKGIAPYINRFKVDTTIQTLVQSFSEGTKEELDEKGHTCILAGRIMTRRKHGKTTFLNIQDSSAQIQVFINKNVLGEEAYELLGKLDIGDIVGIKGKVFYTKTNELSVNVKEIILLYRAYTI